MHYVIIIPGLGDKTKILSHATEHWENHGINILLFLFDWRNTQLNFANKLNELLKLIDALHEQSHTVSLVGCSAGGSAVLNAFLERKYSISKVVNICGRLRTGTQTGFWSYQKRTRTSPMFAQSINIFENSENSLTEEDRKKILTVRALFDEVVPTPTITLNGATNLTIPVIEHSLAIYLALSLFSRPLIQFIKKP
jgi:hypothetical protein